MNEAIFSPLQGQTHDEMNSIREDVSIVKINIVNPQKCLVRT